MVFAFSILFKFLHYLDIPKTGFTFIIRQIQSSSILENKHLLLNLHYTSVFQLKSHLNFCFQNKEDKTLRGNIPGGVTNWDLVTGWELDHGSAQPVYMGSPSEYFILKLDLNILTHVTSCSGTNWPQSNMQHIKFI